MTNDNMLQQLKLGVGDLKSKLESGIGTAQEFIRIHPVTSAVTLGGGVLVGAGLVATQIIKKKRKGVVGAPRKRVKAVSKKRVGKRSRERMFKSKQKHEQRYKRKKPYKVYGKKGWIKPSGSKKRMGKTYYTKKGQPYKIKADGRALFIKKTKRRS